MKINLDKSNTLELNLLEGGDAIVTVTGEVWLVVNSTNPTYSFFLLNLQNNTLSDFYQTLEKAVVVEDINVDKVVKAELLTLTIG